jgi:hypothetical protein
MKNTSSPAFLTAILAVAVLALVYVVSIPVKTPPQGNELIAQVTGQPVMISASVNGTGGTIIPSGNNSVSYGSNKTFTVTASRGYYIQHNLIDLVFVDGSPVGLTNGTYTFTNVTTSHQIVASFTQDQPPVLDLIGDKTIAENSAFTMQLSATDPDSVDAGKLAYSSTELPTGATLTSSGLFSWKPTFAQAQISGATMAFTVTDKAGLTDSETIYVHVPFNKAPVVNAGPDQTITLPASVTLDGSGSSDPEGQPLSYTWSFASNPPGGTPLPIASVVSPVVSLTNGPGTYVFNLTVSDGDKSSTDQVTVNATNAPPAPLVLSAGYPSGSLPAGTTQASLSLTTDKVAICKYSSTSNIPYASMTNFFVTTGGKSHSTAVSGLVNGSTYTYFVRCLGNTVTPSDYAISFSIANSSPGNGGNNPGNNPGNGGNLGGGVNPGNSGGACTPVVSSLSALPTFTPVLVYGSRGQNVMLLQTFLVAKKYLTSDSITGYFGPLTQAAVTKYTKDKNTLVYPSTCPTPSTSPVSGGTSRLSAGFKFSSTLIPYSTSLNVKNLQIFLNDHGFAVTASGVGSKDQESMYYGNATRAALIRFQEYYRSEILIPNGLSAGTGNFGPATLKKINQLLGY